jgi:type IV secretory pathway TraG/TraD family ATPase VirD4
MADVIRWLNDGAEAEQEITARLLETSSDDALSAWNANWNREECQRSSIYTTAETIVGAFADPLVLDATCAPSTRPRSCSTVTRTPSTSARRPMSRAPANAFAAMISELVAVVYETSAQTGRPIDPPL